MNEELKVFIESNIDLIDNNDFQTLFDKCEYIYRAALCKILYSADIQPLNHMCSVVNGMFFENDELTEIIIPEGIEKIERDAFADCYNLKTLNLPSTLKWVEEDAFQACSNLHTVTYRGSVEDWCYIVFEGLVECDELYIEGQLVQNLTIPSSVTRIGSGTFVGKGSLESVVIDDGVVEIGTEAFGDCPNLKTVEIGKTVKVIEAFAFSDCRSLTEVFIPRSVKTIDYGAFSGSHNVILNIEAENADMFDEFHVEPSKVKKLNWSVTK